MARQDVGFTLSNVLAFWYQLKYLKLNFTPRMLSGSVYVAMRPCYFYEYIALKYEHREVGTLGLCGKIIGSGEILLEANFATDCCNKVHMTK